MFLCKPRMQIVLITYTNQTDNLQRKPVNTGLICGTKFAIIVQEKWRLTMKILKHTLLIISLFCTGCFVTPRPVYILEPAQETGVWLMGKQFFHSRTDNFKIALAFDQVNYNDYQFQVEITNTGSQPFIISQENFYLVAYKEINQHVFIDTFLAIDPEQEILELQKDQSREYASYQSEKANNSLFSFLDLALDIASIGEPKTEEDILREENEDLQRDVDELETELDHEVEIKSLNNDFDRWQYKSLRKTTLPQGYLIRGKIYFPLLEKAKSIEIHAELISEHLVFNYNQFEEKVR